MADPPRSSAQIQILNNLDFYDRRPSTEQRNSFPEKRVISRDMIDRLEYLVNSQQDQVDAMDDRAAGSRSQTRRLRVLMKKNLVMYRSTLQQVRESAKTLQASWAILENW